MKFTKDRITFVLSIILLGASFYYGLSFASLKNLGNDEIHTQVHSVDANSYARIMLGKIIGEGNNCPLFYAVQKLISDAAGFRSPQAWVNEQRESSDSYPKILLRLSPVFFQSMSMVALFYFFSRYYSLAFGLMSLAVFFITSSHTLIFWAEARPYSLWMFLTFAQLLIFLRIMQSEPDQGALWRWLAAVHVFLALCVVISLGQIVIVGGLLWLLKDKKLRRYIFILVIPVALCLYYYFQVPKYKYWVPFSFSELLYSHIPQENFVLFGMYIIFVGFTFMRKKMAQANGVPFDPLDERDHRAAVSYLITLVLFLVATAALFGLFKLSDTHGAEGNRIATRYWLFLTPAGIIATVIFIQDMWKGFSSSKWIRFNLLVVVAGVLVMSYLRNYSLWVYLGFLKNSLGH